MVNPKRIVMDAGGKSLTAIFRCFCCKQEVAVKNVDYIAFCKRVNDGESVQDCFPNMNIGERELFVSETCPACFAKLFPPMGEDDEEDFDGDAESGNADNQSDA